MQLCIDFSTSVYKVKRGYVVEVAELFWYSRGKIAPERSTLSSLRGKMRRRVG